MALYEIVETDVGLTVAELEPGMLPEDAAVKAGGVVVDAGPFHSFDEAYDVMISLEDEEEED